MGFDQFDQNFIPVCIACLGFFLFLVSFAFISQFSMGLKKVWLKKFAGVQIGPTVAVAGTTTGRNP